MAHGLASQLGGAMTIVSKPGAGTRIELWLPESAEQMTSVTESAPSLDFELSGSALVVDDEQLVRQSTADMLADLGFTVVEADSGEAALTLIQQGLAPDLLVTDNLMPGMSGTEFPRRTKSLRPATKVLLVSGYAENEGIDPNLPRLTKPFRNIELIESLAALS